MVDLVFYFQSDLARVENALKSAMEKGSVYVPNTSDKVWGFEGVPTQMYNIEATMVEPVFDKVCIIFFVTMDLDDLFLLLLFS